MEFQTLRNEQRVLANKLSEMEMELNEHKYESAITYICAFLFYNKSFIHKHKLKI